MVQNIEHSTLCRTRSDKLPRRYTIDPPYGYTVVEYMYMQMQKMAALGYGNTWEDKLCTRSNTVLIGLPLAPKYLPFTSVRKSSYTTTPTDAPHCALGAHENSVGRRRIIERFSIV